MVKPMKYREITKLLLDAGFTKREGKGDHEKWTAPNGIHVTIVHETTISPGVTRQVLKAIQRSKEGQ